MIAVSIVLILRRIVGVGETRRASRLRESDGRIISDALEGSVVRMGGIGFVMVVDDDTHSGGFVFLAHSLSLETKPSAEMDQIENMRDPIKINFFKTSIVESG